MSFVGQVSETQAGPQLKQIYEKLRENFGFVPNYFQALGRAPRVVAAHLALMDTIMEDGALSRALKEEIGLVVSGINSSSYCIAIHMELLRRLGVEKALGRKLVTDYPNAPVEEKEKVLFRFADKLTRKPFEITQADADAVRQAGWSEDALVETVLMVAWLNFINRVSTGLGLVAEI